MTRPTLSTRQASRRTADAADQLLGWLQQQNGLPNRSGDAGAPSPVSPPLSVSEDAGQGLAEAAGPERDVGRSPTRCAGRTPNELPCPPKRFAVAAGVADDAARAAAPLRPPHTDWLHHRLLLAGPARVLAEFQAAAGGSGTIPWRLDFDRMEEDLFLMLAAPPPPQRRAHHLGHVAIAPARHHLGGEALLLRAQGHVRHAHHYKREQASGKGERLSYETARERAP